MTEVNTLIQLAISILLFATLVTYLLIKIPRQYILKFILIPSTLALALFLGLSIPHLLGYAYPGEPRGEFTYVSHSVEKNGKIDLLAKIHGKLRLYKFPGDPQILQALMRAQSLTEGGQKVNGRFKNPSKFSFPGLYPSFSPLKIHSPHNYGMLPPKNPTPESPQP